MYRRISFNSLASSAALLGALGMAAPGSAQAGGSAPPACPTQTAGAPTSAVTDLVTDNGDGSFLYEFRVCNTSAFGQQPGDDFFIRDWELPFIGTENALLNGSDSAFDNDANIRNVFAPEDWTWGIETENDPDFFNTGWEGIVRWTDAGDPDNGIPPDPFYDPIFDPDVNTAIDRDGSGNALVLHFYTQCEFDEVSFTRCDRPIAPGQGLGIFGFTAAFGPGAAPYQASWVQIPPRTGDPAFPLAGGTPLSPSLQVQAPEPGSLALLGLGVGALGAAAAVRRRRKGEEA
jgi:hypothetical protein